MYVRSTISPEQLEWQRSNAAIKAGKPPHEVAVAVTAHACTKRHAAIAAIIAVKPPHEVAEQAAVAVKAAVKAAGGTKHHAAEAAGKAAANQLVRERPKRPFKQAAIRRKERCLLS